MPEKTKLAPIIFNRERETKNTIRYIEEPPDNEPPKIGQLYVHKWTDMAKANRLGLTIIMLD